MSARTPRRTAAKRTPYKPRAAQATKEEREEEAPIASTNVLDLVKYYKEKDKARDDYIKALKEENSYLRALAPAAVDYPSMTGLTITQVNGNLHCTHEIHQGEETRRISFILSLCKGVYKYSFVESTIENMPEYLHKEIFFEEGQIRLFFFNVYECIVRRE
ncbi:hypothetical protein NEDG_01705 [Nematocida displodere]|uniref:DUF5094 domain-containing protein n=1 Tax=Nematocida displodere TaxID=1805483 RepID=A0A177EG70_9MICR|nr:hypothetical protein NEDG_01705 [Nematocida displodere]